MGAPAWKFENTIVWGDAAIASRCGVCGQDGDGRCGSCLHWNPTSAKPKSSAITKRIEGMRSFFAVVVAVNIETKIRKPNMFDALFPPL